MAEMACISKEEFDEFLSRMEERFDRAEERADQRFLSLEKCMEQGLAYMEKARAQDLAHIEQRFSDLNERFNDLNQGLQSALRRPQPADAGFPRRDAANAQLAGAALRPGNLRFYRGDRADLVQGFVFQVAEIVSHFMNCKAVR